MIQFMEMWDGVLPNVRAKHGKHEGLFSVSCVSAEKDSHRVESGTSVPL